MSPMNRSDVEMASMLLPRVIDRWRALAGRRAARCLQVQGIGAVRQVYVAMAMNDPVAEKRAYENVAANLVASEELDENRFRAEVVARTFDDRFVVAGRALDESGYALRDAEITIRSTDDPTVVLGTATTDDTGRYILDGERGVLDRVIVAGGGITETISHERLPQPMSTVVPADRLDTRLTLMDAVRPPIAPVPGRPNRPTPTPLPSRPGRPVSPVSAASALDAVDGIGPRRRARLEEAGITDLQSLAGADARNVGPILGLSTESATELIKAARKLLRSNPPR